MHVASFLQDFTIDGQAWNDVSGVTEDNAKQAYRDILIYVAGELNYPEDACRMLGESVYFLAGWRFSQSIDWPIDCL